MYFHYDSDSTAIRWVAGIAVVLVALVAINAGLSLFDYNFFETELWKTKLGMINRPLMGLVGLAGILILVTFLMGVFAGDNHNHR